MTTRISAGPPCGEARSDFSRILVESFPAEERDEPGHVLASIEAGVRRCFMAHSAGRLVGLAVVLPLRTASAVLLEYLAVDPLARGGGLGGELFERVVVDLHAADSPPDGLIFEVDPPEEAAGDERQIRLRRIAFYERHGAVLITGVGTYRAPSLTGSGEVPYRLMWRPVKVDLPDTSHLLQVIRAVLVEDYGCSPQSPLVQTVLGSTGV